MSEQQEQWRAVAGYEGHYEVSSLGRVKSLARIARPNYRPRRVNERILKAAVSSNGYLTVSLFLHDRSTSHCVHRLVAEAFHPNPSGLPEVNHRDGVKVNCNEDNLEWCTSSQNSQHAYDIGLRRSQRQNPKQAEPERLDQLPQHRSNAMPESTTSRKHLRSFASMDPARLREITSLGGKTAHKIGKAHRFTPEEAREAGRLGGLARRAKKVGG